MTSDMLSQDEIDALLRQSSIDDEDDFDQHSIDEYISAIEQDALGEIGNITFGSASTALSTLLSQKVDITTPKLSIITKEKLAEEFPSPHVAIHVNYTSGFEGINLLVIRKMDAQIIADLMLGGDGTNPDPELNDMHVSAVQEAMNQMMGSSATSMSTIFNKRVDISPPGIDIFDPTNASRKIELTQDDVLIKVSFNMKIGNLIDSHIMQLIPVQFAKEMVHLLMNPNAAIENTREEQRQNKVADNTYIESGSSQPAPVAHRQPSYQPSSEMLGGNVSQHQELNYQYQQPINHQDTLPYGGGSLVNNRSANVQPVQFSNFEQPRNPQSDVKNLNLLLDIPLQVTVELGRTKKMVKEILDLSPGSIIELDKLAGEPVDILVNNKLIAKGEVVVIEENFGVRVTDILSQWDRLEKLK